MVSRKRSCLFCFDVFAVTFGGIRLHLNLYCSIFPSNNYFLINHWCVIDICYNYCTTPGDNSHLLLSILVKHLDHKNVVKKPLIQINIVNVTTQLAKKAKQKASVAIIAAISDLIKHLRKCLQNLAEVSSPRDATDKWNTLHSALEKCISQMSIKVCDCSVVFQMNVNIFLKYVRCKENHSSCVVVSYFTKPKFLMNRSEMWDLFLI